MEHRVVEREPKLVTTSHARRIQDMVNKHKDSHDINLNDLLYTRTQLIMAIKKILQAPPGYAINDARLLIARLEEREP